MTAAETLPRAFGPFLLLGQLHAGPTGHTFLALRAGQRHSGPWLALKLVSPLFTSPSYVEAFRAEAKAWPGLATLPGVGDAEYGRVGNTLYRASPYLPSKDVQKILTKCFALKRRTPPGVALEIAAQAASTLGAVYDAKQAAHGSVRPAHVLVGYDGGVRLLDFGTAKDQIRIPPESPLGMFYLSYGAPELAHDPNAAPTHPSDLFGAGIVLYELLTNTKLFPAQAPSRAELAKVIAAAAHTPPSRLAPGLPPEVDAVVAAALAASPSQRYTRGDEFARAARDAARAFGEVGATGVSQFLREIFSLEMAQEEQGLNGLRALAAGLPEDTTPAEVFRADPEPTPPSLLVATPIQLPITAISPSSELSEESSSESEFLPQPEEEKASEPSPSTNPLYSLDDLHLKKPPTPAAREEASAIPMALAMPEARPAAPPPPPVPVPEPPKIEVPKAPELPRTTSQLESTLFTDEPPRRPEPPKAPEPQPPLQPEAPLFRDSAPRAKELRPAPAVEPPRATEPKRADTTKAPAVVPPPPEPEPEGGGIFWRLMLVGVLFIGGIGAYLLWRYNHSNNTTQPNPAQTPAPVSVPVVTKEYKYTITSKPNNATILVNGVDKGKTPRNLFFPGFDTVTEYKLTLQAPGYADYETTVAPKEDTELEIKLEPLSSASAPASEPSEPSSGPTLPRPMTPEEKRAEEKRLKEEEKQKKREEERAEEARREEERKKKREEEKKKKEEKKKPAEEKPAPAPASQP